jgi:arylsulfatase A-like enzyme
VAEEQPEEKSSVAGLVLVGALLTFGVVMFLANFSGQMAKREPLPGTNGPPPMAKAKMKAKAKGKAKGPPRPLVPAEELLVRTEPPADAATAPEGAPNVVMVVLTAARRDQLTPYGGSPAVTPFLDRMAAKGTLFDDVISESPFSRASATALLTGRHSWALDMVEPGPLASQKVLPDEVTTMAEVFRQQGWHTFGVTGNFNLNTDTGLAQGFDLFRNAQYAGFAPGRRTEAPAVEAIVGDWLQARPADKPFFLFLNLVDLHAPIRSVEQEVENFDPDEPNAVYRAALNRVDRHLEGIWSKLSEAGVADSTLLVVTADHGEGLSTPEHHGAMHGRLLFDSSVVIPLIVSGPGVAEGHVVKGITAQVDVVPTVLDTVGLPLPSDLDGRSWAAAVKGQADTTERKRAYSATWHFTAHRGSVWTSDRQCQLDFGSVGIDDDFVDACYDRTVDPTFTNVITDRALTDELDAWHNDVMKGVTMTLPSPDAPAPPPPGKAKTKAKGKAKAEAAP